MKKIIQNLLYYTKVSILLFSSLFFICAASVAHKIQNGEPHITIKANYCDFPGKVRITATSDIDVTNWTWNYGLTGVNTATSSYIDVDNAGIFSVSAQSATGGYSSSISIKIAQELVINGDFEMGNTGFTSDYIPVANTVQQGLQPEGTYAVHNSPNYMHNYFWGMDHTTSNGTGKFMLVNGTSNKVIWKQTVTVLPGETYYFSAYAVSLNDVAPFSNLKFQVNGVQVGNPTGVLPSKPPNNNAGTWIRFYGKWDSQTATTAVIEIIDLENAASGNDFGLDDISFGTLAPFLNLTSGEGTDQQSTICTNSPIADISYEVGSDGNEPLLTNIPDGLSTTWDGRTLKISGTPAVAGIYNYSISGTGCNTKTLSGIITVGTASASGNLPAIASTCFNEGGTITLTDKVGEVTGWMTSDNEGVTWNDIANTNSTLNFSNITHAVLYRAIVKNNNCKADTSAIVKVGVHNLWTGEESADWYNNKNWSDETLPAAVFCDTIIIPSVVTEHYPELSSGITSIKNLKILPGGSLIVSGGTLQISGTINNSGTFDVSNGAIEMNGSAAQTIPANAFQNNALKDLIISNTSVAGVSLGGALDVYGSLTYTGTGMKLSTNDFLTIKSTAENTAWVGDMTGNFITGQATVERYIAARKAWYFLSVPTNTPYTMHQLWQENAADATSDPTAGFGIQLTGSGGIPKGFDKYTASPSVKTYNPANDSWVEVPSTNTTSMKNMNGYMVFIRGNRLSTAFNSPVTETVLRTKGPLYTQDQTPIIVSPDKYQAIGNPYASALDIRNIASTGLKDFFYIWDPNIGGEFGYGGYQTLSNNGAGDYEVTPGGGSFGAAGSVSNYIRSGCAFFVQATPSGGSLTFKEAAKSNSAGQISSAAGLPTPKLRATLYSFNSDNSTYIADGLLVNYKDDYSNTVDNLDAIKQINSSENFALRNGNKLLVIERRHTIVQSDTIFLNLTNLQARKYRFEFTADQIYQPGLTGYLEDTYLHTRTPLNIDGVTSFDFNVVNIAGSYAPNRFRIVFSQLSTLPVTFTSVKAYLQNENINVDWNVDNERNIKQYEVEKSADGNHFTNVAVVAATANNGHSATYNFIDKNALEGFNYYRIKSVDDNGKIYYTNIVKVLVASVTQEIAVYPNPVINGKINLQLNNQPDGNYGIRLLNKAGQLILEKKIQHSSAGNSETIQLSNYIAHGIYELKVVKPDGSITSINIIYQ